MIQGRLSVTFCSVYALNRYPDMNADLINAYRVIASKPNELISILQDFQSKFHAVAPARFYISDHQI